MLADGGDQAGDVDDRAPGAAQVGQRQLGQGEHADHVQLDQGAEIVERELIDRLVRRMPAGVVDQAVQTPVALDRASDERDAIGVGRDVAPREVDPAGAARGEGGGHLGAARGVRRGDDDGGAGGGEDGRAAFPDALRAPGDDDGLPSEVHDGQG